MSSRIEPWLWLKLSSLLASVLVSLI